MTAGAIQDRVSPQLARLSPQVRRAAHYLLDNTEEVATRSLRQVAGKASLSPSSFSRLARALGCESYEELRELCRSEIRERSSRFADKALKLLEPDQAGPEGAPASPRPFLLRQAASAVTNIQTLLETIDLDGLEGTARRLADARKVVVVGTLGSYAFADYLSYIAGMAFDNWRLIGRGGSSLPAGLAGLGAKDVALVLTKEPHARRSVEAARLARQQGAQVIAVTDRAHAPISRFADRIYVVPSESPQFFPSYVSALVLLEALIGMVLRMKGAEAQERVAEVERQNHLLGEYWQE